jgi:hypothetical protein
LFEFNFEPNVQFDLKQITQNAMIAYMYSGIYADYSKIFRQKLQYVRVLRKQNIDCAVPGRPLTAYVPKKMKPLSALACA